MGNNKLLLIGGYPKGHDVPFHPSTKSGKVLHGLLQKHNLKAELLDLWDTEREERDGSISSKKIMEVLEYRDRGFTIIALGRHVYTRMLLQFKATPVHYLPHPASRRRVDIEVLEKGLIKYHGGSGLPVKDGSDTEKVVHCNLCDFYILVQSYGTRESLPPEVFEHVRERRHVLMVMALGKEMNGLSARSEEESATTCSVVEHWRTGINDGLS